MKDVKYLEDNYTSEVLENVKLYKQIDALEYDIKKLQEENTTLRGLLKS